MLSFPPRVRNIEVSQIKRNGALVKTIPGVINLGQGIPSFVTPGHIREKAIEALKNDPLVGKYTVFSGLAELKSLLALKIKKEGGRFEIDPEKEIFITAGAIEAMMVAILSLVEINDEVVIISPIYNNFINQVKLAQGRIKFIACREKDDWQIDIEKIKKNVSNKTKALILCNPNNPTGTVYNPEILEKISELAVRNNFYLLVDETYGFLTYDNLPFTSSTSFPFLKENLIRISTFSKEYAMTGWRLGYIYAPKKVVDEALKVHDALVGCPPTISQIAGLAALKGSQKCVLEFKEKLEKRRNLICQKMAGLSDFFSFKKPQGSYFLWVKLKDKKMNSSDFCARMLKEVKVAAIPGCAFGLNLNSYFRISFGVEEEEIKEGMRRLLQWLKNGENYD